MTIDETLKKARKLLIDMIADPTDSAWQKTRAMEILFHWPYYDIIRMKRVMREYDASLKAEEAVKGAHERREIRIRDVRPFDALRGIIEND